MFFKIWGQLVEFDEISQTLQIPGKVWEPKIRTYGEIKDLYINKNFFQDNEPLYLMFRDVYLSEEDEKIFKKHNLRYDVTVILPKKIDSEYNKTYGHYHPDNYKEIYQVLEWEAIFLQQNQQEVFYTHSQRHNSVIMEKWYGHISINPTDNKVLVLANIVSNKFSPEYDEYKYKQWWAYYYTDNGFVKNPSYEDLLLKSKIEVHLDFQDIYTDFLQNPEKFSFLN